MSDVTPTMPGTQHRLRVSEQSPRVQRFVRNVRILREQKGWSAQRLEEEVLKAALREGVESTLNRSVITNLENNRRSTLTLDEALLFAATLNTTLSWLADFAGPACTHCQDNPPTGYACKVCLADHDVRWKPMEEKNSEQA